VRPQPVGDGAGDAQVPPKRRMLWPFNCEPSPMLMRPFENSWRSQAVWAITIGERGNAIVIVESSTCSVCSAASVSESTELCLSSPVEITSKPAASASRTRAGTAPSHVSPNPVPTFVLTHPLGAPLPSRVLARVTRAPGRVPALDARLVEACASRVVRRPRLAARSGASAGRSVLSSREPAGGPCWRKQPRAPTARDVRPPARALARRSVRSRTVVTGAERARHQREPPR